MDRIGKGSPARPVQCDDDDESRAELHLTEMPFVFPFFLTCSIIPPSLSLCLQIPRAPPFLSLPSRRPSLRIVGV